MSPEEQIARLEGLLERVRKNAQSPRARAPSLQPEPAVGAAVESEGNGGAALIVEEATSGVIAIADSVDEVDVVDAVDMSEPFAEVEVEELELSEEEIVDLTDAEADEMDVQEIPPVAAAQAASAMDEMTLDWEEVEEHPASSRRPIAAASMDEALAEATEQIEMDDGREIPLKTPPPESGPQEAPSPQQALAAPPIPAEPERLSEADILSAPGPMELAEPPVEAIEIVEPELAAESGDIVPDVVVRPAIARAAPSAYVAAVREFRPHTFVELLDASLSLGE